MPKKKSQQEKDIKSFHDVLGIFIKDSKRYISDDKKCDFLAEWFRVKKTANGFHIYITYEGVVYNLGERTDIDVQDCHNALTYLKVLCYNLYEQYIEY